MITAIHYKSFKSLVETMLPLEPLTILIGTNSSGKTNTLEGMNLLASLATKAEISQTLAGGEIRGDANYYIPFGEKKLSLGCDTIAPLKDYGDYCRYEIEIENFDVPLVVLERMQFFSFKDEDIEFRNPPIFTTLGTPNQKIRTIEARVDNFARGGIKPSYVFNARIPMLFQLIPTIWHNFDFRKEEEKSENLASGLNKQKNINSYILNSLASIFIVDPKADLIRSSGYISKEIKTMDKIGGNLSAVLFNLLKDEQVNDSIFKLLKELPENQILKIDFEVTSRGEVRLYFEESFSNETRKVPLELLSDGTIRLLAILASVYSIPKGGLMVVEEIDNSLHPSKVERLLQLLERVAEENEIRLLVTSHNPTLMDAVKPQKLRDVILCYREKNTGYSKLIRVTDIPDSPELLINESLGALVRDRKLEKQLKKSIEDRTNERLLMLELWKKDMEG